MSIPQGRFLGTYKAVAAAPFAAATSVAPFSTLTGAANKVIKVKGVKVNQLSTATVEYVNVLLTKYSTAASGGTSAGMTETPLSSSYPTAAAVALQYTAAPTAGTSVGAVASHTVNGEATTEVAGIPPNSVQFLFPEGEELFLFGAAEQIGARFGVAPAGAVTVSIEWLWDEFSA